MNMPRLLRRQFAAVLLIAALLGPYAVRAQEQPVVRAILFWMEGCQHCHFVLEQVLPPLQDQYGDQLDILLVELSDVESVNLLYQAADSFGIPKENVGVPFLVIGDRVLVGSEQIPAQLPGLIETHLASGGVNYPDLPGLVDLLSISDSSKIPVDRSSTLDSETPDSNSTYI